MFAVLKGSTYHFTASIALLPRIRATKSPALRPTAAGVGELCFFEDRAHGVDLIRSQPDQPELALYEHAALLEMTLAADLIRELMEDPAVGRVSPEVHMVLAQLGRGERFAVDDGESTGVLVLSEVAEAPDSHDGLTHRYILRCRLEGDPLLERFNAGVRKLTISGGIPGAISGQ